MSRPQLICGDAFIEMAQLKNGSVQLVIFSPSYGLKRKKHYDSIAKPQFANWLVSFAEVVKPKLTPTGAMVIIIEPGIKDGQEAKYVTRAILDLQNEGWSFRRNY